MELVPLACEDVSCSTINITVSSVSQVILNEMDHVIVTTTTEQTSRNERPLLSTEEGMFLFISFNFVRV